MDDLRVLPFRVFLTACALFILSPLAAAHAQDKKVVGYYYGKASRAGYDFSKTPVEMLTHLIYSQAKPTSEGGCDLAHPDVDLPNLAALKTLRAKNPRLLILLSVGGWSGSMYFSDVASTAQSRKQFSASCVAIVEKYGFDGLDIDWEYPVTGGKPTDHKRESDKENFVLLLQQLRTDLDASSQRLRFLTIASTCYRDHLNDLAAKEMATVLDWFNIMCYDLNDMQPGRTSHGSALFAGAATPGADTDAIKYANSDAAVGWYLNQGVPPEKIVLGVPFYGQIWSGVPEVNAGLYQPYAKRPGEEGTLSFREIEKSYLPAYSRHWDDQAKVPWLYNGEEKIMISYEDSDSLTAKAKYVRDKGLGGMMFWDISQDDAGSSLLHAINRNLSH